MAYRIEGKDIVISGFENGIADTPYAGIADMRNMEIVSVPGEAATNYSQVAASAPPVRNAVAYTSDAATDRITIASTTGFYEGVAVSLTPTTTVNFTSLVIGGGGGGGGGTTTFQQRTGGGGGAGQVVSSTHTAVAATAYTVTVGGGGAGGTSGVSGGQGVNGSTSSLGALASAIGGGGGGGGVTTAGKTGASGGGGGPQSGTKGTGTAGFDGGAGNAAAGAGGGGGSSAIGADGAAVNGGNGGAGTASSISGASVTYAGGGGGGDLGVGGSGGGGTGGSGSNGTAGTANTGSGGGGAGGDNIDARDGGAGGSGIVIISYTTGAFTATGGTITTSGGNTIHTFTTSGTFTVTDLTPSAVYYVRNLSGNTFQLSLAPQGSIVDIVTSGTGTLTTYQYGNQRGYGDTSPVARFSNSYQTGPNGIYLTDASNYAWVVLSAANSNLPGDSLIFLGNIGGVAASTTIQTGIATWNGYLFIFGVVGVGIDVANISTLFSTGPAAAWTYAWKIDQDTGGVNRRVFTLVSQEDSNLYWTSASGLGSIIQTPGDTFDPADSASYTITDDAVSIPQLDKSTCIAELGSNLLIGGYGSFVYVWDKISLGFNSLLNIPDPFTTNIIATSQNAYVFSGVRGRIYVTNGSGIDLFKKIPDYVTGSFSPYITWRDAAFARNELYFTFTAQSNADAALTTVAGAWAINLETTALRMINKTTNSGYSAITTMVIERPFPNSTSGPALAPFFTDNPAGSGVMVGWYSGSTYGIDVGSSAPYSSYESYLETDMIPVGTYLDPSTFSQIEWKTSAPLGGNGTAESVRVSYRTNINEAYTTLGTTTATGTSVVGSTTGTTTGNYAVSDYYQANFQKVQWVQFKVELSSNSTTPTYARLTELRVRDYPSGKNSR